MLLLRTESQERKGLKCWKVMHQLIHKPISTLCSFCALFVLLSGCKTSIHNDKFRVKKNIKYDRHTNTHT